MPFWTAVGSEPKRSFRYLFYLQGAGRGPQPYVVQTVKKPSFTIDGQVQAKYIQHTFKYPGRVMWQDVTVTIIDPRGAVGNQSEDAALILDTILETSGYSRPKDVPTGLGGAADATNRSISKANAVTAIGNPKLNEIDANGVSINEWTLKNAYLSNVDFGQLSYNEDSLVTYTLTVAYDYAEYKTIPGAS